MLVVGRCQDIASLRIQCKKNNCILRKVRTECFQQIPHVVSIDFWQYKVEVEVLNPYFTTLMIE